MKDNKNESFSLLNQQEIDTLVQFLINQKNSVDSDIMNQQSIDKLINLITTDKDRLALNVALAFSNTKVDWNNLNFKEADSDICELQYEIDSATNYMKLYIYNQTRDTKTTVTPANFNEKDITDWGFAVSPISFCRIATFLFVKFKQETYDEICAHFAKCNYGNESTKLPEILLPDNDTLVASII